MASRIWKALSSGIWVQHLMFPNWFGYHESNRQMINRSWWRSIHQQRRALSWTRNSRTEYVNVFSPGFVCYLMDNFRKRNIMVELWAVACKYWLIYRSIAGKLNHLARYISCNRMRATGARILLGSAMPKSQDSISQRGNELVQMFIIIIIYGNRFWRDNTL